ncbi:hypothetical protein [Breznakiella homolactica]|uniref:L-fucose isomerase n=1 Tax=Breznakiella homolactica TaxID=2798577 RepID=A0A7T8BBS0_9SPIR|nr:hypothetical protein [Breznakiella homolactica]QQO09498.1 hypothetical protein JFL75_00840 [Breznakiella homolactica]
MPASAMEVTLSVKPLMGILVHSDFWEGPCRGGIKEEMMPDAELKTAREKFKKNKPILERLIPQVKVLDPVFVPYTESFVVDDAIVREIETDMPGTDCIMVMNQRIPKIERFGKPVISYTHAVSAADICAYLRSIGREGYYAIDLEELNELLHLLWVRKAVSRTRPLILTAGESPTWGLLSNIRDLEGLRSRFGIEIIKKPYTDIFPAMDSADETEARRLARELAEGSQENKLTQDDLTSDLKYYLAAQEMMDRFGCNAFSTACVELCRSRIPQARRFVPCITHSLLKDRGMPSGCEEDLNALTAMTILMYTSLKPAFMGNPLYETDEVITLHHSVPCLQMNGFDAQKLDYKIYPFTGQGFGGKIQIDFAQNREEEVTLARFDPTGTKMLVKTGKVLSSEYKMTYCSPYYFIEMDRARDFLHAVMDFGHHQVLVFGDQRKKLRALSRIMGFEIVEP